MTDVLDALIKVDMALNQEVGPRSFYNPVEVAMRELSTILGVDWREVGEHTYNMTGGK